MQPSPVKSTIQWHSYRVVFLSPGVLPGRAPLCVSFLVAFLVSLFTWSPFSAGVSVCPPKGAYTSVATARLCSRSLHDARREVNAGMAGYTLPAANRDQRVMRGAGVLVVIRICEMSGLR